TSGEERNDGDDIKPAWRSKRADDTLAKTSPILAISARTFRSQLFGEQTSYLRGILRIARKKGMRGYVFSPGDIDWTRLQVKGWTPAGSRWRRSWFPLPDVVYERAWGLGP